MIVKINKYSVVGGKALTLLSILEQLCFFTLLLV